MIKKCKCASSFQDALYGPGMRVHTESKKGEAKCTVCGPKAAWHVRLISHAREWKPQFSGK